MSDFPLLMFPRQELMRRPAGDGRGIMPHKPGRARQAVILGPRFDTLRNAFEAERLVFQANPQGLAPECVLVIETRGRIEDFHRAARAIGMDRLDEIDLEDLEPDDDFWIPHKDSGELTGKSLDGRLIWA